MLEEILLQVKTLPWVICNWKQPTSWELLLYKPDKKSKVEHSIQ